MTDKKPTTPKHVILAYEYGLMVRGWCFKDYIQHAAVAPDGYEVVAVDGVQRAGKSNQSLQIVGWAKHATQAFKLNDVEYKDYKAAIDAGTPPADYIDALPIQPTERDLWEAVLECIQFKASEFTAYLGAVPDGEPTDACLWDDIAGHYSNMSFRISPEEYAQVDGAFTVLGTKARVIVTNIPNLTRLSKNIKDHLSFEIFIGKNKKRMLRRIFRLPGLRSPNMNEFKADVEAPSGFDIYRIPAWAWTRYEKRRFELARDVFKALGESVDMDQVPPGYLSIPDAIRRARDRGAGWGVSTIQQNASRGAWKKVKAQGEMFIEEESFMKVLEAETYKPGKG